MSVREQKYEEMIQFLRAALVERRENGGTYRALCDQLVDLELRKPFDMRNQIIMRGLEVLRGNLRISIGDLRKALHLTPINDGNQGIGFIEKIELQISASMYRDAERNIVENGDARPSSLSRNQPQRINFRSRTGPRSQSSHHNAVIVIRSDSETESEAESESVSVGCPRSVCVRLRQKLEPQLRERIHRELKPQFRAQIYSEMEPQLRTQIRREMEPQLRAQILREIEPPLREQIRREITPQLSLQIHRELEPQMREQIRREILPTRHAIEDEIRNADEHSAWVDFLLYIIDEHEPDITLDQAIAICEICISPCMNRRPIVLNCGHIFCGKCIHEWCYVDQVCPKCRTRIIFNRSVFRSYPSLDAN